MVTAPLPSPLQTGFIALHLAAVVACSVVSLSEPMGAALAQDAPAVATDSSAVDGETAAPPPGPEVHVDPETGERYVEVRPRDELARGRWPTDRLVVIGVVSVLVLLAIGALGRRISRSRP